ncbi:MAG: tetratricopeptide repeat protein, partial [Bacteroidetes bacterium]|nr:tetratricopeptide repeat protein [Bacteroidota bacterium]
LEALLGADEDASEYFEHLARVVLPAPPPHREAAAVLDDLVGQRVRRYQVLEHLGGGGMGVVYKARDERLGRLVALKFLPPYLHASETARTRFKQEARAASALDHPNIGVIHEIDETEDGLPFIAMAYYAGETLKARIARGAEGATGSARGGLPLDDVLDLAIQITEGLACAHASGIVHRDVKPANVMVTKDGTAKIVDFGLAKVQDTDLTRPGTRMGTMAYMSPEQARGDEVDARTDLWALGVVLYEMVTGKRPFEGAYAPAILYAILHTDAPPVPGPLGDVVQRCLAKDPSARYATAAELLDDLRRLRREGRQPALAPDRSATSRPAASTSSSSVTVSPRTRWLLVAGVVLVGLMALGWWWQHTRPPEARYLAVLPFRLIGETDDADVFSAGLLESLTSTLSQLEQFQDALWVVPASEIADGMTPTDAREQFGATLVVTGSIQVEAETVRLTLNLIDAVARRQIDAARVDHRSSSALALQDEAILTLARMLQVRLSPQARETLTAGSTTAQRANAFYLRGQGYLRSQQSVGDLDSAIDQFKRATEEDPSFALAYAGLGEAYWQKYRTTEDVQWVDEALAFSQQALAINDRLAPVYISLGIIHSGLRAYDEALQAFDRALQIDPLNAEAYRYRAITYRRQGRNAEAETAYQRAIALKPDYWRGYNSLGVFYYVTGRYPDAVAQFEHGLRLAPANLSLLVNLGAASWQQNDLDGAVEAFENVLTLDPDNATATSNLATAYFYQGQFAEATRLYQQDLARRPLDYNVQGFLGDAYYWMPNARDRAQAAYARALELAHDHLAVTPDDPVLWGAMANYHAKIGQADSARAYLTRIGAQHAPDDLDAVAAFGIGETYEFLGRRDQARTWMRSALARGVGWMQVRHSPWLTRLRRDAAFQTMIDSLESSTP